MKSSQKTLRWWMLCSAAALLSVALVRADTGSVDAAGADGTGSPVKQHGRHGAGKRNKSVAKNQEMIHGSCMVIESPSNPIAGPCADLMLVLNDSKGNEVERTRTTSQGKFDFSVEKGKTYRVASGSKYYDVVGPNRDLRSGEKTELKLQQK